MDDWFKVLFFGLLITFFVSQIIGNISEARRIRRMWAAIAKAHGWHFDPGRANLKGKISGTYQGRNFHLTAYINYQTRNAPAAYTEVVFEVENLDDIMLYSNWPKPTLFANNRSAYPKLTKLKSGDGIFDGSFRFHGTPVEQAQALLQSYEVRAAIRKIYPMNTAVFEHPTLKVQKGDLYLRTYYLHEQAAELQKFIADACYLAETLALVAEKQEITSSR